MNTNPHRPIPYVKIIHQPAPVYRMRYKAEKRTTFLLAESALATDNAGGGGAVAAAVVPTSSSTSLASSTTTSNTSPNSNPKSKSTVIRKKNGSLNAEIPDGTFPKIQIINGCGPATLIVSCVNKCEPFHVHPHRLIGEKCKSGVAVININRNETFFELSGVSIEFTKKHDMEESINELKNKNVDPFNVGFDFIKDKSYQIDLTQLRLCFQVYLRDSLESNEIIRDQYHILKPVLSNIICNSSRKSTLQVMRASNMCSPSNGGANIVMFLKRLEKDQKVVHVKFFDSHGWSSEVKINDNSIHYQSAIMFTAPPYKIRDNTADIPVSVKIYVPFKDEKEKQEFIKQQNAEEKDDEDSSDATGMDISASTSNISANNNNNNSASATTSTTTDVYKDLPYEGKYESPRMEFIYKPPDINPTKRRLDTLYFYEFHDIAEREATDEVSKQSRKNLAKRQHDLLIKENLESNSANLNISEFLKEPISSQTDPIFFNFLIKHSNDISTTSDVSSLLLNSNNSKQKTDCLDYINETGIQAAIENRFNLENEIMAMKSNEENMMNDTYTNQSVDTIQNMFETVDSNSGDFKIESIINLISSNDSFFQNDFLNK